MTATKGVNFLEEPYVVNARHNMYITCHSTIVYISQNDRFHEAASFSSSFLLPLVINL